MTAGRSIRPAVLRSQVGQQAHVLRPHREYLGPPGVAPLMGQADRQPLVGQGRSDAVGPFDQTHPPLEILGGPQVEERRGASALVYAAAMAARSSASIPFGNGCDSGPESIEDESINRRIILEAIRSL